MEEILLKLRRLTQQVKDSSAQTITDLKPTIDSIKTNFDEWKAPWTQDRAEKLDSLDQVGSSSDADTMATVFGKLAEIKKISAERRTQLAATLGLMDVTGLSGGSTAKNLADGLDSVPIVGAVANTLTTTGATYTVPRGYHNGRGKVQTNIANLVPGNVRGGVNVGGVVGEFPAGFRNVSVSGKFPFISNATIPLGVSYRYYTYAPWVGKYIGLVRVYRRDTNLIGYTMQSYGNNSTGWVYTTIESYLGNGVFKIKLDNQRSSEVSPFSVNVDGELNGVEVY